MSTPLNNNARVAPGEDRWRPAAEDWTVPGELAEGAEPLDDEDRRVRAAIKQLPDSWLDEDVIVQCLREALAPLAIEDATATALMLELVDEGLLMGVSGGMKRRKSEEARSCSRDATDASGCSS